MIIFSYLCGEMLVKGGADKFHFKPRPVWLYFLRVIITTLQKSITTEINHTEITNFFFISISILKVNGSYLPPFSLPP